RLQAIGLLMREFAAERNPDSNRGRAVLWFKQGDHHQDAPRIVKNPRAAAGRKLKTILVALTVRFRDAALSVERQAILLDRVFQKGYRCDQAETAYWAEALEQDDLRELAAVLRRHLASPLRISGKIKGKLGGKKPVVKHPGPAKQPSPRKHKRVRKRGL
ncbi:MAG: hypothetical protein N2C14_26655, partial [Planctomycetales bacterium]